MTDLPESADAAGEGIFSGRVILCLARCAVPVFFLFTIRQVRQMTSRNLVTPVPFAPDWLRGVAALGGDIIPAVSLELLLGLPGAAPDPARRHLVLRSSLKDGSRPRRSLVETGPGVTIQPFPDNVRPAPPDERIRRPDFVRGLFARADGGILLIPHIDRILTAPQHLPGPDHRTARA